MSTTTVRPFSRADRDQVTYLVNAHVGTVIPGCSVPVSAVLGQLERDPGEHVVDPWVVDRATIVAVRRDRVAAAAHLLRYGADERVGPAYRDTGEIRWLLAWPDAAEAGEAVLAAALEQLSRWGVQRACADGSLPAPAVYGVPESWPHVRRLFAGAGFTPARTEIVLVACVADLPAPGDAPLAGLTLVRDLGTMGTRFVAVREGDELAFAEVESDITHGGARGRLAGWAELDNLHVADAYRGQGLRAWVLGQAAEWLRLGRAERLLAYATPDETDELDVLAAAGFRELSRTERGWARGEPMW